MYVKNDITVINIAQQYYTGSKGLKLREVWNFEFKIESFFFVVT